MRIAYWDANDPEMYFDNPNLRWGSPSYLLEPGDPGYVPVSPVNPQTKQKTKKKLIEKPLQACSTLNTVNGPFYF